MSDDEVVLSASGGTMVRLAGPARPAAPDLAVLEPLRIHHADRTRPAGPPYLRPGDVLTWRYGGGVEMLRVVRDDERGLVAWLPGGSERLVAVPLDGRGLRERTPQERAVLARDEAFVREVDVWRGPGILRVAPAGVPWSVWWFTDDDGSFAGHYVNLELPHLRPADGAAEVHTRDLTLDLWLGSDGELWLKDVDELDAAVTVGHYSAEQARQIRAIADQVHHDLVAPRAWPLDEGWELWRPPAAYDEPLVLPAPLRPDHRLRGQARDSQSSR